MEKGKENSIINSLKRLERFGDENSKFTEKITKAANELAAEICKIIEPTSRIDDYVISIGDYLITEDKKLIMKKDGLCDLNTTKNLDMILEFSRDLKNGLLDKIFDYLKKNEEFIMKKQDEIFLNFTSILNRSLEV